MRFINKWSIGLLILILGVGGFLYLRHAQAPTTRYITQVASMGSISVDVSASGTMIPLREDNAGFSVAGKIATIGVKVGDSVKSGQTLAQLDTTTLQSQVDQSRASVTQAEDTLQSKEAAGTPSPYNIANLQDAINTAQIKVNEDDQAITNTQLVSPKDGIVSTINGQVGDMVGSQGSGGQGGGSSTPFMVITDTNGANPQNLYFATSGKVTAINVKVGDHITQGAVLAQLDSTSEYNQLSMDQAALNEANNNLQNAYVSSAPTSYDIDNMQQSVNTAQLKLQGDENTLKEATLTSTINGIVANINNAVGDSVGATGSNSATTSQAQTAAVMTIIDPTSLVAYVQVAESDIAQVKVGQIAQLSFDALGSKTYVGTVQQIDTNPTVSSNVTSYGVKIALNTLDPSIKPGMSVSADILVQNKDNVLTVPNSAVNTAADGSETVQIMKSGKPQTVNVTTGLSNDTDTEITSGLHQGDQVVTSIITPQTQTASTSSPSLFSIGGRGGGGGTFRAAGGG